MNPQLNLSPKERPLEVVLGLYSEQIFTDSKAGDDLRIGPGTNQGGSGIWTHPAIRRVGIGSPARVDCSLTMTSTGDVAGYFNGETSFILAPDSGLEIQGWPIGTRTESEEPWKTLISEPVVLRCHVEDGQGRAVERSVEVVMPAA